MQLRHFAIIEEIAFVENVSVCQEITLMKLCQESTVSVTTSPVTDTWGSCAQDQSMASVSVATATVTVTGM